MTNRPIESEVMKDLSGKNFGLLIAYILPGAIVLIGLGAFLSFVRSWLLSPSEAQPTVGGFLFVTLASVAAGMTASAVRWATVDRLHHWTGVVKPAWDDSKLNERLEAFEAIVEAHSLADRPSPDGFSFKAAGPIQEFLPLGEFRLFVGAVKIHRMSFVRSAADLDQSKMLWRTERRRSQRYE